MLVSSTLAFLCILATTLAFISPDIPQRPLKSDEAWQLNGKTTYGKQRAGGHQNITIQQFKVPGNANQISPNQQYSGYLFDDGQGNELFFWMIISPNPKNDPVILWLDGGPGGASSSKMLDLVGPKRVGERGLENAPASMTERATYIFLDHPIQVGFSAGDEEISTTPDDTEKVIEFLQKFLETDFKITATGNTINFKDSNFYLHGTSFSGHYVPSVALKILEKKIPVKLKSILVGNPAINRPAEIDMAFDYLTDPAVLRGEWNIRDKRSEILGAYKICSESIKKCVNDNRYCKDVIKACDPGPDNFAKEAGWDPYNLPKKPGWDNDYYKRLGNYMVDSTNDLGGKGEWEAMNWGVWERFVDSGDYFTDYTNYYGDLLDKGVKVLIYMGEDDLIVPYLSTIKTATKFGWNGQGPFKAKVDNNMWLTYCINSNEPPYCPAKYIRQGNLVIARVPNEGHSPGDSKAIGVTRLLYDWIDGGQVFKE